MDNRYPKFLAVAKYQSFSKAAKELGVSQPAITLAIASLESHLNVKLFVRKRSKISLTEEGKIVVNSVKKIANEDKKLREALESRAIINLKRIGVIDSIGYLLYASAKDSKFLTNLEIMVDNSKKIISDILANKIEVGLITAQPGKINKDLKIHKSHSEKFVFVRSAKLPKLKKHTEINDWLAFNKDSTTYNHFVKQFNKLGLKVRPIFFSTSIELLKDMAVDGKGTALLPLHLVEPKVNDGSLIVLNTKPLNRPIWAIMRTKNKTKEPLQLAEQVDDMLAKGKTTN